MNRIRDCSSDDVKGRWSVDHGRGRRDFKCHVIGKDASRHCLHVARGIRTFSASADLVCMPSISSSRLCIMKALTAAVVLSTLFVVSVIHGEQGHPNESTTRGKVDRGRSSFERQKASRDLFATLENDAVRHTALPPAFSAASSESDDGERALLPSLMSTAGPPPRHEMVLAETEKATAGNVQLRESTLKDLSPVELPTRVPTAGADSGAAAAARSSSGVDGEAARAGAIVLHAPLENEVVPYWEGQKVPSLIKLSVSAPPGFVVGRDGFFCVFIRSTLESTGTISTSETFCLLHEENEIKGAVPGKLVSDRGPGRGIKC